MTDSEKDTFVLELIEKTAAIVDPFLRATVKTWLFTTLSNTDENFNLLVEWVSSDERTDMISPARAIALLARTLA